MCDHSRSCAEEVCANCGGYPCPLEESNAPTQWTVPEVNKKLTNERDKHAPNQMVHVQYSGTRAQFMEAWEHAIADAVDHKLHVKHQKEVINTLKAKLPWDTLMTRWDFLMNYTHVSSIEVGNAFYGRRQSTVLIATVWYHDDSSTPQKPIISKTYHAFVSPYLAHSSLVFQKAFSALLPHIPMHNNVTKCIILTDGGAQHFKNRMSLHWATKAYSNFELQLQWIVDPAYHGKGECDGHGALLKKMAKIHVLKEEGYIDNADQLVSFFDTVPGGSSSLLNIAWEDTYEDVTPVKGILSHFNFRFGKNPQQLWMRKWPCACTNCVNSNFHLCTSSHIVGAWVQRKTSFVSVNHPKGLDAPKVNDGTDDLVDYEVEKIMEVRTF